MTCYETLRTPAPAADAPMAHHFVKWWRNKFRNGYKKFSAGTESERTDTEELVSRATSQCSAPPDLLPTEARAMLHPSATAATTATAATKRRTHSTRSEEPSTPKSPDKHSHSHDKPRLRFEELTCDVELQHSEPSKQQPLQFSFTLYDLDGHGRMTKDDIAGIVSTIYESIGKSVTVPHYGSKTIQVRLTVVPEDSSSRNQRREGRRRRRRQAATAATTASTAMPTDFIDGSDDEEQFRLSPEEDVSSKSSSSGERRPRDTRPAPAKAGKPSRHARNEPQERKHTKVRSGSLQRRELLEIIQANMEKNHLNFQTTRKPSEHVANEEEISHKYQKLRNRSYTVSEKPKANTFQKTQSEGAVQRERGGRRERGVAGGERGERGERVEAGGEDPHLCRYDRYLHAVVCSSTRHAQAGYHHPPRARPRPPRPPRTARPARTPRALRHSRHRQPRVLQIIFL